MEEELTDNAERMAEMRLELAEGILIRCHYCLAPFTAHSLNARYCSTRCRNLASQDRRAEERIEDMRGRLS